MNSKLFLSKKIGSFCCALAICTTIGSPITQAGTTYKTVALTGQTPAGIDSGEVYTGFAQPVIDNGGRVAFLAAFGDAQDMIHTGTGIWTTGLSGVLELEAASGQAAPGTEAGVTFAGFNYPAVNVYGQTTFYAGVTGPGVDSTNNTGIWSTSTGSLDVIARHGYSIPVLDPGVIVTDTISGNVPQLNDAGQTLFYTNLNGPGITTVNDAANHLHNGSDNTFTTLIQKGDPVPGASFGDTFLYPSVPQINNSGQYVVRSGIAGPSIPYTYLLGIWTNVSGQMQLIALDQSAAADQAEGVIYDGIYIPLISDSGRIVFETSLEGPGINYFNDSAIYEHVNGTTSMLLQADDDATDAGPGITFDYFNVVVISDGGVIGFSAGLDGPGVNSSNEMSLWVMRDGALTMAMREGDSLPGADPDVIISNLYNPMVNDLGQMATRAYLEGPGIDDTNDKVILATNEQGEVIQVVRTGELFDVNNDPLVEDLRTISDLGIRESDFMLLPSLNDNGQLCFYLEFTDGSSGIFTASTWLAGDLDGDGFVGLDDLDAVLMNWNQNVTPGDMTSGDANGDGYVGLDDLDVVLVNWNQGTPAVADVIPEPGVGLWITGIFSAFGFTRSRFN